MNPIASLLAFSEASGWHPIIPAAIIAFPIALVFAIFLIWLAGKDKKKYFEYKNKVEKDTNPVYATWYRSYDYTPPKGAKAIILNEDQWVVVQWDKEKGSIVIFTPPRHEDRKPIDRQWLNAKFEEAQKVQIEDLARIH
jgi:hypothetical protein